MEEAKGYLERIASGLLILESAPDDQAAIDAIFREAHTMKGAAGMVGMMRVSRLAHRLEDLLVELRDKKRRATPELTDAMLLVVDGLGRLIASASGTEQDTSDEAALERLLPTLPGPTASIARVEPAPTPPVIATPPPASTSIPAAGVPIEMPAHAPRELPTAHEPAASPPKPAPVTQPPGLSSDRRRSAAATLEVPVARIDELNRLVGEASAAQLRVGHIFGTEMQRDPDAVTEYRELTKVINQLQEVTERTRMVPVATLEPILHRTVRDSARAAGKDVRWEMVGEDIEVDRGVLEELVSPLLHIVRNSVGHGVELPEVRLAAGKPAQATVRLQASQVGSKVVIAISDDGAGINVAAVRASAAKSGVDVTRLTEQESLQLIFRSGVSTAKVLTEE
jgi:two-component system chemotaxis sensor kinase CheA